MGMRKPRQQRPTHDSLHTECKLGQRCARTWSLRDAARKAASRSGKPVVLALGSPRRPGWLHVVHTDDMDAFLCEYLKKKRRDILEQNRDSQSCPSQQSR